jgi:hypothetical protein
MHINEMTMMMIFHISFQIKIRNFRVFDSRTIEIFIALAKNLYFMPENFTVRIDWWCEFILYCF